MGCRFDDGLNSQQGQELFSLPPPTMALKSTLEALLPAAEQLYHEADHSSLSD
jgi:hypothetical protein